MLKKLELINFRNYREAEVEFSPDINIIWGENGQGKTNLLEAVHVISFTKSMRTNRDSDLIKIGEDFSLIKGDALEIRLSASNRRVFLNDGVKYQTAREWLGLLPTVFFGPQELSIVKGEPGIRRRFMDMAICQYKKGYTRALSLYNKAREQKSKILRDFNEKPSLLDILPDFNEKMINSGEIIIKERRNFIAFIKDKVRVIHGDISDGKEKLEIEYLTKDDLRNEIESSVDREIKAGQCLIGPHKDDIVVSINRMLAKSYASQGQVRTAALSLKIAEKELLAEKLEIMPIMLLDDVFSELDGKRRDFIINNRNKGQTLITDCGQTGLKSMIIGKTLHIGDGRIGL